MNGNIAAIELVRLAHERALVSWHDTIATVRRRTEQVQALHAAVVVLDADQISRLPAATPRFCRPVTSALPRTRVLRLLRDLHGQTDSVGTSDALELALELLRPLRGVQPYRPSA